MVIKRYVVKDMPEAVILIRKELGKDAVILSTKRIRMKKWLGLWRQSRIEVLAAIGDDVPVRAFDAPFLRESTNQTMALNALRNHKRSEDGAKVIGAPGLAKGVSDSIVTRNVEAGHSTDDTPTVPHDGPSEWHQMREEIAGLRRVVESTLLGVAPERSALAKPIERLTRQGVPQEYLLDLFGGGNTSELSEVQAQIASRTGKEDVDSILHEKLAHRLAASISVQPIDSSSRLVMFVGPTGVGKTTTIAKIAALQVLSGKRKVGLITTDTFRIAAVEQLRTYANILNVPLEVVVKPEEIDGAMERLSDCDLVFIDTAGRNFAVQENVEHITKLLEKFPVDEVYLVLALTSKEDDLNRVIQQLATIPIHKFLFTKLDETQSYGTMLNLLLTYHKPLSYFTTGQNVPNDIEIASLDKLLQLVFTEVAV